jgi:hypothetical protein
MPLCPPQIPSDPGSNPGRRGGKPVTNRLNYGTPYYIGSWLLASQALSSTELSVATYDLITDFLRYYLYT